MEKIAKLFALLLMPVYLTACGQKQSKLHQDNFNYDTKDTVTTYGPNAMVRNVKQGKNGTILFAASRAGVFRYDGKAFTNIASKIGTRRYWDVLEDRRGNLWFATTDSGIYRYNGKTFQHFTTREGLANNTVMCIYEDRAGIIWLGTGGGISRYDGRSFRNFTTKDGLPDNGIHTILEDKTGKLWIGSSGDACFYDGKTFTVPQNKDGKAFTNVWGITEDKKGNIWFGATIIEDRKGSVSYITIGLWRYDGISYTKVSARGASAIIEDKKGNIWTTGEVTPNGYWTLSRYDQKSLYDTNPTATEIMTVKGSGMLCGILEANDGSIWVGALGAARSGVFRYDGKTITDFRRAADQK